VLRLVPIRSHLGRELGTPVGVSVARDRTSMEEVVVGLMPSPPQPS